ncbi:MAG TPA: OmpA family protein [Alphaproteobacteria bacterium]|nr:OmpA family protein [Alphaproteobacteria bacterium]
MKMLRPLLMLVAVLSISACSFDKMDEVKALNETNAVGNAFTQELTKGYQEFINSELNTYKDHADALHFSRKGLAAARGDMVMPEPVSDWELLPGNAEELIVARSRLVNVFALGARETQPDLSAFAQVKFDCWIEEQEENFQADNISACKSQFMDALAKLEAAMPAPAPAPEPANAFDVNPAEPMKVENAKYIVFFDWDEYSLNAGANAILDAAAEEAKGRSLISIDLVGHTDTSGSRDYNEKLSMKRANVVRDAMVKRGVDANLLTVNHRGEDELLVQTPDDVREPANRRTEITFQ